MLTRQLAPKVRSKEKRIGVKGRVIVFPILQVQQREIVILLFESIQIGDIEFELMFLALLWIGIGGKRFLNVASILILN